MGNRFFLLAVATAIFFRQSQKCLPSVAPGPRGNDAGARDVEKNPSDMTWFRRCSSTQDLRQSLRKADLPHRYYLGKETVQNVMVFAFQTTYRALWNRNYVDHVQSHGGNRGVEHPRRFFTRPPGRCATWCPIIFFNCCHDRDGAADFRLMPMKSVTNKPSASRYPAVLARRRTDEHGARPIWAGNHRCHAMWVIATSQTWLGIRIRKRFVALKIADRQLRWAGVPFYLRTGKRLAKRVTEIVIHSPHSFVLFRNTTVMESRNQPPRNSHSTG